MLDWGQNFLGRHFVPTLVICRFAFQQDGDLIPVGPNATFRGFAPPYNCVGVPEGNAARFHGPVVGRSASGWRSTNHPTGFKPTPICQSIGSRCPPDDVSKNAPAPAVPQRCMSAKAADTKPVVRLLAEVVRASYSLGSRACPYCSYRERLLETTAAASMHTSLPRMYR